jgi:hypothetical protein
MSESDSLPLGAAIAGDVLSALMIPGASTLGLVAQAFVQKKRREAAGLLIEEISNGFHGKIEFEKFDVDPLIEIIYRFSKAVDDGAARENLRLLAQIIAGLKKHKSLDGDKFRKWCAILEQLTRDELLVIGKAIVARREIVTSKTNVANDFFQRLSFALDQAGYSKEEIGALLTTVSRTGLIVPQSAYGGMVFMPTPWLDELGTLADLESVGAPNHGVNSTQQD